MLTPPQLARTHGNAEATTAPTPMNRLCMEKPKARCPSGSMSPTSARNGSIVMLIDASRIHSVPAATHSQGLFGITSSISVDRMAP